MNEKSITIASLPASWKSRRSNRIRIECPWKKAINIPRIIASSSSILCVLNWYKGLFHQYRRGKFIWVIFRKSKINLNQDAPVTRLTYLLDPCLSELWRHLCSMNLCVALLFQYDNRIILVVCKKSTFSRIIPTVPRRDLTLYIIYVMLNKFIEC